MDNTERRIYTFRDQQYDPLVLWRELIRQSGGEINKWFTDQRQDEDLLKSAVAEEKIVVLARAVFDLPSFPDTTDTEALDALEQFNRWLQGKGGRG